MRIRYLSLLLTVLTFLIFQTTSEAARDDRYVRLRYVEGDVIVHPAGDDRGSDATINTPILDGDELETREGRAELAFSNGIVVRVGDYSAVRIESTYTPMTLNLLQGTIFIDSMTIDSFRDVLEVRAGDAQVYLIDEGNMRVDLGTEGSVRVTSIEGEAEVRAGGRRVLLEAGERTYVDSGQSPERPTAFSGERDDLDNWNESRLDFYAGGNQYGGGNHYEPESYVDEDIYYDSYDLNYYGDWRAYGSYGNVWVPRVDYGWRPYYDGRWSFCRGSWFWVSYEPWGWAPYHYGRWGWAAEFGWYWIPGSVFGPSWVSWYDYGNYIGWCPLNYYNRPIWYYGNFNDFGYRSIQKQKTLDATNSWTFVKKQELGSGNIKKVAAPATEVRKIRIEERKISKAPQRELVNHVLPKTQRSEGFVNDKRMVKQPGDVRNPIGSSHRNNQFSRGKQTDSSSSKGASKNEIVPRKGPSPSPKNETGRQPLYTPGKRSYEAQPRSNSSTNRDQQFSRPNESKGRYSDSYRASPHSRSKDPGPKDAEELRAPYSRGPRSYETENSTRSKEVSPRYSDEAKKLFQRFEEQRGSSSKQSAPRSSPQYRAPEPRQNRAEPPKRQENRGREKQSNRNSGNQKPNKH